MNALKRSLVFVLCIFIIFPLIPIAVCASAPKLTTQNYTLCLSDADDITYIRFAKGSYTTVAQIKNAEGCITVGTAKIQAATVDNTLYYEMPDGGIYSIWVKKNDGSQYIYTAVDMTQMTPELSVNGVNITLSNVYGISDFFIAEGSHTSYAEIKTNGYIVRVTSNKLENRKSYTYTLKDEGDYTLLIRYGDKTLYEHFNIDCINPAFEANGLQLTVKNLKDVKCIRTAYGSHTTVSAVKKADTHRAFTAKAVIKGADEYTIQYRQNGIVTIAVQYENGYTEFYEYNVKKKESVMSTEGNKVSFGNLDGLVMIRYAKGSYTTAPEIKNAPGSKYIKPNAAVDGMITLTLDAGCYSFYVQYDDESYNFYTVNIPLMGEFTKHYQYTKADGSIADSLNYWLYTPGNATQGMPLVIVLHSAHVKEISTRTEEENLDYMMNSPYDDIPEYIYKGMLGDMSAYIVMPQTSGATRGWAKRGEELTELVEYCQREYGIDPNKVSIMGYSLGGTGAIEVAAAYPTVFKRVICVAGGLDGVTNNTRPYMNKKRIDLTYYPELKVLKNTSTTEYEEETMRFLYAGEGNRYLAATDAQKQQALAFEAGRIADIAHKLSFGKTMLWTIAGELDAEVTPTLSQRLCKSMAGNARYTYLEGCSHAATLRACLEYAEDIKTYICNW